MICPAKSMAVNNFSWIINITNEIIESNSHRIEYWNVTGDGVEKLLIFIVT